MSDSLKPGPEPEKQLTRGSVTSLLDSARSEPEAALANLWQRYWESMVRLAGRRCQYRKALVDPEFIAQSVFNQVCQQIINGELEDVKNRGEFWGILLNLTRNKAIDHIRRETRLKRGGDMKQQAATTDGPDPVDQLQASRSYSEEAVDASDLLNSILVQLDREDPQHMLSDLLQRRIAGQTVTELAEHYQLTTRTIERKLNRIRSVLSELE